MDVLRQLRAMTMIATLAVGLLPLSAAADVVLTVHKPQTGTVTFTMEQLRQYPEIVIETTTPWTDGEQRFVGIALQAVLGDLASSDIISLQAVNDYVVSIPASDVDIEFPVVAYKRNGEAMSIRDKGPLWLIYPFDSKPEFRTETIFSRSIWQLVEITVGR